ncbi:hypothetical protein H6G97_20500 [Nostoc flagelliforme FACHB-838]|uniref:Uncharacterized protein n=1 Tax=Nostoc flagelliforme FACHB-838 TaxID=2692904 RepID=A0ABR8DR42_9NOSO|nr:hypothetical protein [Nostoc flagelliforme]MBD2531835.1 hypothetical protein [Nostoc flagelliforme FACHB-838]
MPLDNGLLFKINSVSAPTPERLKWWKSSAQDAEAETRVRAPIPRDSLGAAVGNGAIANTQR